MFSITTKKQYRKDFKRFQNTNSKNIKAFKETIISLCERKELPEARHDHALIGNYRGCRECHLSPDWLLIYIVDDINKEIVLVRIGSHNDLF
ncbi:MAG: type II toxin-antitoxin system mRNA interferase toxin, RelE/StbE family [Candidatus Cloacimonadota bacterium]|nr:MAG: type II toxin-antitoxin system mRNA interferase toxin, RelE/StbE family [Candidatus Cloacimonadota bacterium]